MKEAVSTPVEGACEGKVSIPQHRTWTRGCEGGRVHTYGRACEGKVSIPQHRRWARGCVGAVSTNVEGEVGGGGGGSVPQTGR